MRMLTGFMPPTEGSASIAGHDVVNDSLEARRSVGYLPERVPVYPDMTVRAYVTFWAKLRGVRNPRSRVDAALERVQLARPPEYAGPPPVERAAPAARIGAGARPQPACDHPRRADDWHRPAAGHRSPRECARARHRSHRPVQHPHPLGSRAGLRPRADHGQGARSSRRANPPNCARNFSRARRSTSKSAARPPPKRANC